MKSKTIFAAIGAFVGISGMAAAFLFSASPYVTVDYARKAKGDNFHVAGDIVPGTVQVSPKQGVVSFQMRDESGTMQVHYKGQAPSNLSQATKAVAIGGFTQGNDFEARKLMVKCPSKYEGEKKS